MASSDDLWVLCADSDQPARESTVTATDAESDMRAIAIESAVAVESGDPDYQVTEFDLGDDSGLALTERVREQLELRRRLAEAPS